MQLLLFFILGMAFYIFAPVLESFSTFLQSCINKKLHSWQVAGSIEEARAQNKINKLVPASDCCDDSKQTIGFVSNDSE